MKKIELEIIALQSSITHAHSYAVILGEIGGNRKIPIVIGAFEAQAIAVAIENVKPKRPLTHDLMASILDVFSLNLKEVLIYRLEEGIFYAKLIIENNEEIVEIDCRTSDAISIAVRLEAPIYAYENIVSASGLEINEVDENKELNDLDAMSDEDLESLNNELSTDDLSMYTLEELEELLKEVLENEDYSTAIKIRDEIKKRS